MQGKITYTQAMEQLEAIVQEIEQGEKDVDLLTQKTEEAVKLIAHCRKQLTQADERIRNLLASLTSEPS